MTRMTDMPSPRGTNHAGLFVPQSWVNPVAAYDSATGLRRDADDRRRREADDRHHRRGQDWAQRHAAGRDEGEPLTAEEILDELAEGIINSAPTEEHDEIVEACRELADGGHAGNWADDWMSRRGDRRRAADRRRRATDQPPAFPGRPEPGGTMTTLARNDLAREAALSRREAAEDARRRRYGMDSAPASASARKSFAERFPNAAAVRHGVG
jgi:hypothetical protein